ncbi:uncharacterized protein BDZ99DRAFT_523862 [Mytilinidion resinicola]|uniref:Protein kinase domain-containing protein n=1 Tax=Mytilinidion resinicola TaxID=574789 RepID=A0A6A6YD20_9PEZI|nr:uncharacterized protein BDZ99DRAFT_523862 [Mytilinidion resinicola]KAF2806413.1 hypothetical protein BDZ99DRAFT_523862 [Mytilinidion resinicola]
MIDGLSIAGLTIASVDQLLKLGERTAQLVSDMRAFQDVNDQLRGKIQHENYRTDLLRRLLFDPAPAYGGSTLFENFDEEGQDHIRVFLGRVVHTLREAHDLLEKRYGMQDSSGGEYAEKGRSDSSSSLTLLSSFWGSIPSIPRTPSPRPPQRTRSKGPMLLLRWSLQDKKRTEEILNEWIDLNSRIREDVKMMCLTSSIGLNTQHLRRLEVDEDSKELGFNLGAALQLSASQDTCEDIDFRLSDPVWMAALSKSVPIDDSFAALEYQGKRYLQETRKYEAGTTPPRELDQRSRERVNGLASLLSRPKETEFCIPRCVGWEYVATQSQIAFIFETPERVSAKPVSLLHLLRLKEVRLSLSQRLALASALATCISQLHMVKWVHESFRSENILFFPGTSSAGKSDFGIDYSKPNVLGFAYSRPDMDFSAGLTDVCMERDVYRHPDRQGCPANVFIKRHDIYALGVVLLEIGLWQPAITLESNNFKNARDPVAIKMQLLKHASRRLGDKMGDNYAKVVDVCLTGEFGIQNDTKEDLKLQQAFHVQVVEVLARMSSCL